MIRSDKDMLWKVIDEEYIFKRPWLTARKDKVKLPNGKVYDEYYVLSYPTWVNVIAETTDGLLILERQYRHAVREVSIGICAGCVEEGETPLEGAKRELKEETGYGGGEWTELLKIAPNSSTMDNFCHCYYAKGVARISDTNFDDTEDIELLLKTKEEVFEMLKRGDFHQAMMVAPLWKYFATYCRTMIL